MLTTLCIPGTVPNPINMPDYCYFRDRCDRNDKKCNGAYPPMIQLTDTHYVACYHPNEDYVDAETVMEAINE